MSRNAFAMTATALVLAAAVGLSGCSGDGGDNSMTGADTMPGDTSMPGGDTPPDGSAPQQVGFMTGVDRSFSSEPRSTALLTDDGTTTVERTETGWTVTVLGKTVTYANEDFGQQFRNSFVYHDANNDEFVIFWSLEDGGFDGDQFDYMSLYAWNVIQAKPGTAWSDVGPSTTNQANYAYMVEGTLTSDMPVSGTAEYRGRVRATDWPSDDAVFSSHSSITAYRGDFNMTATFGATETSVTGEFSNLTQRVGRDGQRTPVPGSFTFKTPVTGNQLSVTDLQGAGPLSGYENIDVRAGFFGPAAAEVGGVFEGENPSANKLISGYFTGKKQ